MTEPIETPTAEHPFGEEVEVEAEAVTEAEEGIGAKVSTNATEDPYAMFSSDIKISNTSPYPFINKDGELKLGLAITIENEPEDSIFGDADKDICMLIVDSETKQSIIKELSFGKSSLSKASSGISDEIFNNLSDVRKTVSLSKPFKNLINTRVATSDDLPVTKEEKTILDRTIKKTGATSKDMKMKIMENSSNDLEGTLNNYQFKKHMLITGDAGEGKTYIVDKFIDDNGLLYVQENGHVGLEAIDLVGHMIKLHDGSFGWKDGSLSQAFRMATAGTPVVYFIDEMLRIPARELNILVGSLTPNSRGELKLRTNRPLGDMDGIVAGEEITIPQNMLWVVATTNQGAGYQSSRIDEALKDRFRLFYQEMDMDKVAEIITEKYKQHKASAVAVKAIVSLIEKTREIKSTGNIPRAFTIRHLSEAIDTANNLRDVKKKMIELVPNIVSIDSDGKFNSEQMSIVSALIKKVI